MQRGKRFPAGEAGFRELLELTGQTLADIEFRIKSEVAVSRLRRLLAKKEHRVAQARVAAYYSQNKRRFVIPERREVVLAYNASYAAAARLVKEIEAGKRSARARLDPLVYYKRENESALEVAIFRARPNTVGGPVRAVKGYAVFEMRHAVAGRQQTLGQVEGSIEADLIGEQRQEIMAAFTRAWHDKWRAKTDCRPGFVVSLCEQSKGLEGAPLEEPFTLG